MRLRDYARRSAQGTFRSTPWRGSIDLFDADGRFLCALESDGATPEIGQIQVIGPDGRLYTSVNDPFPQVHRYRVEIDELESWQ
jgi:hypothetical protein